MSLAARCHWLRSFPLLAHPRDVIARIADGAQRAAVFGGERLV